MKEIPYIPFETFTTRLMPRSEWPRFSWYDQLTRRRMKAPDFDRVYETFVRIPEKAQKDWQLYIRELRDLSVLITDLKKENWITWWCFLVHDCFSGVPDGEKGLYIHIRMELLLGKDPLLFLAYLPPYCIMTRKMKEPKDLDMCEVDRFTEYKEAWAVMGESSEWVLHFVELHKGIIPHINAAQIIHYQDNMLQLDMINRDLTRRLIRSRIFRLLNYLWKRICL